MHIRHMHHPNTQELTEAAEIIANVAVNVMVACLFVGGILLGLGV